jgi:hypothetical protein
MHSTLIIGLTRPGFECRTTLPTWRLSIRFRLCVRISVRFHDRFAYKGFRVLITLRTPMTIACQHISGKISFRTAIPTQKSMCKWPLDDSYRFRINYSIPGRHFHACCCPNAAWLRCCKSPPQKSVVSPNAAAVAANEDYETGQIISEHHCVRSMY